MLEIRNLHASVEGNEILKGIDLKVNAVEVHSIMGPNGSGKSTLSQVLAGNEAYEVTAGQVTYRGQDLLAAVQSTVADLEGAFALGVISRDEPGRLVAARRDSNRLTAKHS